MDVHPRALGLSIKSDLFLQVFVSPVVSPGRVEMRRFVIACEEDNN
jgi:hypothetical protein